MGGRRALLVALLAGGVAFLAGRAMDGEPVAIESLRFDSAAPPACDTPAPPPLLRADGTQQTDLSSIRLNSNTYLSARLCAPTLVRLKAEGSAVDGVGARLAIHLGQTPLFDDAVTGTVELELEAPSPGWLLIAFTNDLYRPPLDRNLWLRDLELIPAP